jgi:hypothetical protein
MTTEEIVGTVGDWKLAGFYTDESPANKPLRILTVVNTARLFLAREAYKSGVGIADVLYQEFELDPKWESKCSFYMNMPKIATFPAPRGSAMDGIFPRCNDAEGLQNLKSESRLRAFKRTIAANGFKGSGVYVITGDLLKGELSEGIVGTPLYVRAIFSSPQLVPQFNIREDQYPINEDMLPDIKKLLEGEWGKRYIVQRPDSISNSQVDNEKQQR